MKHNIDYIINPKYTTITAVRERIRNTIDDTVSIRYFKDFNGDERRYISFFGSDYWYEIPDLDALLSVIVNDITLLYHCVAEDIIVDSSKQKSVGQ